MNTKRNSALVLWAAIAASQCASAQVISNEAIRDILRERIDERQQGVGIVVGVIDSKGRRVVAYGKFDRQDTRELNGDTVFEIGSMSKVFTALLLADMANKGEVKLDDPIGKFFPSGALAPERNGKSITLLDLATHTSALPRMPGNFAPKNTDNPYVDYSTKQMYEFVSSYQLPRDIGSRYEYSNLAVGLLGNLLERKVGTDYESLVKSRIAKPLGMNDTTITLTAEMQSRLAPGHDGVLNRVPNWDMPTFAGAGALRSTANDLLKFLAANLAYETTPLSKPMASMLEVRRPMGGEGAQIALGWHVEKTKASEIIWHNGGTGGYRSYFGFDPRTRVGVVVLSNTAMSGGDDDIGRHLIDPAIALAPKAKEHKEVHVDAKLFDNFVGSYEIVPGYIFKVTREGDRLFGQTGTVKGELHPESELEYFSTYVDMQFTFVADTGGKASRVIIHQNGRDTPANRIEDKAQAERKELPLDSKILDLYVGRYQLAPNFFVTVTRVDNALMVKATGQDNFPIFAQSETEFFYKVVDAQITFVVDSSGRASSLVLHQGGRDMPANRIE
jgi:CubicO group peptidase (beta-lactamase class C family)